MLQFGYQAGRNSMNGFRPDGIEMHGKFLRIDCQIGVFDGESTATCRMSILEHQHDQIYSIQDKASWKHIQFLFKTLIIDASRHKKHIQLLHNQI